MSEIDFLSVDDVCFAHRDQVTRYGGDPGIRDIGLLESAVLQAQATFGGNYLCEFPFEMAASYLFHIVQNHPFVDGNKRAGAVAGLLFLAMNGIEFNAPAGALYEPTMSVANGLVAKVEIVEFFRSHAFPSFPKAVE